MAISESGQIAVWLKALLTGDSTIAAAVDTRVYEGVVPQAKTQSVVQYPAIVFNFQGGADTTALGGKRAIAKKILLVKAVGQCSSYEPLEEIAGAFDTLLDGARAQLDGFTITISREGGEIRTPAAPSGVQYRQLGGIYRVLLSGGAA